MNNCIRYAQMEDLERIKDIYAFARDFMAKTGNPNQWGKNTPAVQQLVQDIQENKLFVICENDLIHGVFYFWIGPDPSYSHIEEGAWRSDTNYGAIHRIAGDGSGGILRSAVSYARAQINHLRIDTHHDNKVMQNALAKQNFQPCGIVYMADGSPRIAYDYLEE